MKAIEISSSSAAAINSAVQVMHIAWGAAWFVGYGLVFLHDGPGGRAFVPLPSWLPLTVLFVLLAGAGATTAVLGIRVFARGAADEHSARHEIARMPSPQETIEWMAGIAG